MCFCTPASNQKPALAPKPSVKPAAAQTDLASRLFVYQRSSTAVGNKVKPSVAPKPCLSKIPPPAINSKSKFEHHAHFKQKPDRNVGLVNFRNGTHVENNKPEWDYIVPICVCSHGNCADCVAPKDGNQKVLQREGSFDPHKHGMNESFRKTSEDTNCLSEKHTSRNPQKISQIQNANQSIILNGKSGSEIHQKNAVSSIFLSSDSLPERNECQQISSNIVHHSQFPEEIHPPRKNAPVATQRNVKTEKPNVVLQASTGLTRTELTVLPVDVNNSDLFTREITNKLNINTLGHSRAVNGTQNNIRVAPVPAPRKKIPRMQQQKTQDVCRNVDAQEIESQNLDSCVDASADSTYGQYPVWRRVVLKPTPENSRLGGTTEVSVDGLLKKMKMFRTPLCEIKNEDGDDMTQPQGKPQLTSEEKLAKQSQPNNEVVINLKPKSKSLSSIDMRRPDGLKKPSLIRIMDLDVSVKKVPRLVQNGQPSFRNEQSVDTECYLEETQNQLCSEGLTSLHNGHIDRLNTKGIANLKNIGIEQSVDGDDLEIDAEHVYDHVYEDIVEYENLPPLSTANTEVTNHFQKQPFVYVDDGLYEYPYVFTENATKSKEHQEILQRYIHFISSKYPSVWTSL